MTKNTEATETATPCACSLFEAVDGAQLTPENLETGNIDYFDTGCTSTTRNTFAPGHDAKLKSHLIKWGAQGLEISRQEGAVKVIDEAEGWAMKYEFGYMVIAGLAKAKEKAQAKADRDAAKAERKAAKGTKKPLAEVVADEQAAHTEAEATKVADREASQEWDDAVEALGTQDTEPEIVKAKVGRWTYEGTVGTDGSFTYAAKLGGSKTVEAGKFQLV